MIPSEGKRQVRRVHRPSTAEFGAIVGRNEPVVLTGLINHWPALTRWSPEYLKEVAGEREVYPEEHPSARFFDAWCTVEGPRFDPMPLAATVDHILNPPDRRRWYLGAPMERVPELRGDYDLPSLAPGDATHALIFGGPADSPLHYHPHTQVLLCQVTGKKRIAMYRPGGSRAFYAKHILDSNTHLSAVNFDDDVAASRPRFRDVQADFVFDLAPGEVVFIPVHWWHVVNTPVLASAVQLSWIARLRDWTFPDPAVRTIVTNICDRAGVRQSYQRALRAVRRATGVSNR